MGSCRPVAVSCSGTARRLATRPAILRLLWDSQLVSANACRWRVVAPACVRLVLLCHPCPALGCALAPLAAGPHRRATVRCLCPVAGVDRSPKKVTRDMSKKKFNKRTSVKPFVKYVNYNHVMPTRYTLDVADKIKTLVNDETLTNEEKRKAALKTLKTTLDERCVAVTGSVAWLLCSVVAVCA